MTATAILSLVLAATIIWGGFVASVIFLATKSEVPEYPAGLDEQPGSASKA